MPLEGTCIRCGGHVSFVFHYSKDRAPMAPTCAKCRAIPQKKSYEEKRKIRRRSWAAYRERKKRCGAEQPRHGA